MENEKKPESKKILNDDERKAQGRLILPTNKEFGFLYKKCQKIRPWVLSEITLVPEFMEALRSYEGTLDDDAVFEIIKKRYIEMYEKKQSYRTARAVMNAISKDVKGDSSAWQK